MARGPKPQPTALKILRGNPGRRPLPKNEPAPAAVVDLAPPPELEGPAAEEWRRIAPKLQRNGLLTELDPQALIAYCVTWAHWVEAEQQIRDHGMVIKGRFDAPVLSPWVAIASQKMTQLKQWLAEFGMTPAARTKVKTDAGAKPADRFARYDDALEPWK